AGNLEDLRLVRQGFREGPQGIHLGEGDDVEVRGFAGGFTRGPYRREEPGRRRDVPGVRLAAQRHWGRTPVTCSMRFSTQGSDPGFRLSIIVPTLDEAAGIEATLGALAPARARGAEAIVVDGGSRDATRALAA